MLQFMDPQSEFFNFLLQVHLKTSVTVFCIVIDPNNVTCSLTEE